MKPASIAYATLLLAAGIAIPPASADGPEPVCYEPDDIRNVDFPEPTQLVIVALNNPYGDRGIWVWAPDDPRQPAGMGAYDFFGICGILADLWPPDSCWETHRWEECRNELSENVQDVRDRLTLP